VGGQDFRAEGGEFVADDLVGEERGVEGCAGDGVGVGVGEADAGEAEGGAGEPEALVVEVWSGGWLGWWAFWGGGCGWRWMGWGTDLTL